MAKKNLKFGNVFLCEHVAKGDRNKYTLVNVFSGDVLVDEIPARMFLGIYIEHFPDSMEPQIISFDLQMDKVTFGRMDVQTRPVKLGTPGVIAIPIMEVGIDKDLTFTIVASADGYKTTTVLSKKVSLNPAAATSPNASLPPSLRSPSAV